MILGMRSQTQIAGAPDHKRRGRPADGASGAGTVTTAVSGACGKSSSGLTWSADRRTIQLDPGQGSWVISPESGCSNRIGTWLFQLADRWLWSWTAAGDPAEPETDPGEQPVCRAGARPEELAEPRETLVTTVELARRASRPPSPDGVQYRLRPRAHPRLAVPGYDTFVGRNPQACLSTMAVHRADPGLSRRLGAGVPATDGVVVDVPGGEADHAVATDRPDALAVAADVPDPRGVLR